jgi:hypothetical protein
MNCSEKGKAYGKNVEQLTQEAREGEKDFQCPNP